MSTFKRRSGGAWTNVADVRRSSGGSWTDAGFVQRRTGGAWELVWPLYTVAITDQTLAATAAIAAGSRSGYRLNSSGIAEQLQGAGNYITLETWLTAGDGSLLEARATVNSGTLTSGTTGSWLSLASSQEWYIQDADSSPASSDCNLTIEIRHAASGVILDSAIIDLTSNYEP